MKVVSHAGRPRDSTERAVATAEFQASLWSGGVSLELSTAAEEARGAIVQRAIDDALAEAAEAFGVVAIGAGGCEGQCGRG